MAKHHTRNASPKWLTAVNLDTTSTIHGDLVAILGMIDDQGQQIDYCFGRGGAEALMKSLQNFIDVDKGRPLSFPTPQ